MTAAAATPIRLFKSNASYFDSLPRHLSGVEQGKGLPVHRGPTGRYEAEATAGEVVRALVPNPLPPQPVTDLSGARQLLLERAWLEFFLDGVAQTAGAAVEALVPSGIAPERTGGRRNRVFANDRYLATHNEGPEPR